MTLKAILKPTELYLIYYIIQFALIIQYLSDGMNKIALYANSTLLNQSGDILSFSLYIRASFELIVLLCIVLFFNRVRLQILTLIIILFITFVIGIFTFANSYQNYFIGPHITIFNKYIYVFILYALFYKIKDNPILLNKCMGTMVNIFFINSILSIIGLIMGIGLFESYYTQDFRYGYDGLIPAINEASLFYMIGIGYLYYKETYLSQSTSKLKILVIFIGSILLGAKAIYFFLLALLIFHVFRTQSYKAKIAAFIVMISIIVGGVFFIQTDYARNNFDFFFRHSKNNGLFSMLVSGRDLLIKEEVIQITKHWNFVNVLFGGQDQQVFILEMDVLDLFLMFGIIGALIYYLLMFSTIFNLNYQRLFSLFFVIIYFILGGLGGHFFSSAMNSLYLCLFTIYLKSNSRVQKP